MADQARPRVLIIEDDPAVSEVLVDILQEEGYAPACVLSDELAYGLLDAEWASFAALIADINLGVDTTGYDVARYARGLNPRLPIFYLTGASPESVDRFGVADGVLIAKPFTREALIGALRAGAPPGAV